MRIGNLDYRILLPRMTHINTNDDTRDHRDFVLQYYNRTYDKTKYSSFRKAIRKSLPRICKYTPVKQALRHSKPDLLQICKTYRLTIVLAKKDSIQYWSHDQSLNLCTPDAIIISPKANIFYGTCIQQSKD